MERNYVKEATLTAAELRSQLDYDPETGVFIGTSGPCSGAVAGTLLADGYTLIRVSGPQFYAHLLVWLYMTGKWPPRGATVDHRSLDRGDNRFLNLRLAGSKTEQLQNRRLQKNNTSGYTGVVFLKHVNYRPWNAQIRHAKRRYNVGRFDTAEEANTAYLAAKRKLHLFQPTHVDR